MSLPNVKSISALQISDLEKFPVWQFTNDDKADDTAVRPIELLPMAALVGKVIGTRTRLANGDTPWAILGNLDAKNAQMNEHFATLSVERNSHWFHLARYHDGDYLENGPDALARFLGLAVDDVFPISYDVREYVTGYPVALAGSILKEPRVRLTRDQIVAMAIP